MDVNMLEKIPGWDGGKLGAFGKDQRRVSANFCVRIDLIRFVWDK
jgi:hypothetical protein